jgi:hypothetical protein
VLPNGSVRVCPTPEHREDVVRQLHGFAHLGEKRTLALLQTGYWWRGMRAMVRSVVQSCKLCDMANTAGMARPAQLQPLEIKGMFYRWGIDLAGPLPATKPDGYTFVMVCIEHFTKWVELFPLRSKTARETAQALTQILTCFGAPAEVVTDRGAEWAGAFDDLLQQCFVDHRRTSADHPQADGAAERMVQVVKSALRKHSQETQRPAEWDTQLPWLAFAYRCSVQASTRYAPYRLLYGVDPVVPPAVRERLAESALAFSGEAGEAAYADALAARATFLRLHMPAAAGNLLIAQKRDTLRYAQLRSGQHRRQALEFAPGDYVYVRRSNANSTLDMPVRDPVLRVVSVGDLGVAVLVGRDGGHVRVRVEQLLPCHLPDLDPIQDVRLQLPAADLPCELCGSPAHGAAMLLCDGCGTGWHTFCLRPPLSTVPEGDWLCPGCVALGRTAPDGPQPMRPERSAVLFPRKAVQKRDEAARRLGGARVLQEAASSAKRRGAAEPPSGARRWGTLRYRGPLARPWYFMAEWDGETAGAQAMQLTEAMLLVEAAARAAREDPLAAGQHP